MKTLLISLIGLVIAAIANAQNLYDPAICDATQCVCFESESLPGVKGPCRDWMNQAYGGYESKGDCGGFICAGYDKNSFDLPDGYTITMPNCNDDVQPCPAEPPFELPPPVTEAPGTSSPTEAAGAPSAIAKSTGVVLVLGWVISVLIMK